MISQTAGGSITPDAGTATTGHLNRMETTAVQVGENIAAAFPARRKGFFQPIANSTQGDEPLLTAAAFADKDDWTRLDAEWLDEVPDGRATALIFLSSEAICFYIPAFIVADLRGGLKRAEPMFSLTHGFDDFSRGQRIRPRETETWTDYAKQRWSHLTSEQARVIVQYLEWRIQKDGIGLAFDASQALSRVLVRSRECYPGKQLATPQKHTQ